MLISSHNNSTPFSDTEGEVSQTPHPENPNQVTLEPPKTSQLSKFSSQSFVYAAHAILMVAALGIVNWLHSSPSTSPQFKLQLSERWIDWQVAQD
jgi:hypothetical protein